MYTKWIACVVFFIVACTDKPNDPTPPIAPAATPPTHIQAITQKVTNPTAEKISEIRTTLPKSDQSIILRIESCDHLTGELNGIPSEDIEITKKIDEERCSELDSDIAKVTDTKLINAIKATQKLLEEQFN